MEITINIPEWIGYILVIWFAFYLADKAYKFILWILENKVKKLHKNNIDHSSLVNKIYELNDSLAKGLEISKQINKRNEKSNT